MVYPFAILNSCERLFEEYVGRFFVMAAYLTCACQRHEALDLDVAPDSFGETAAFPPRLLQCRDGGTKEQKNKSTHETFYHMYIMDSKASITSLRVLIDSTVPVPPYEDIVPALISGIEI